MGPGGALVLLAIPNGALLELPELSIPPKVGGRKRLSVLGDDVRSTTHHRPVFPSRLARKRVAIRPRRDGSKAREVWNRMLLSVRDQLHRPLRYFLALGVPTVSRH